MVILTLKEKLEELKYCFEGNGHFCHVQTYEAAIEALEKQLPMKPLDAELDIDGTKIIPCGNCGEAVQFPWSYCPYCGQKIDWQLETYLVL